MMQFDMNVLDGEVDARGTNYHYQADPPLEEQKQIDEREYEPHEIFDARLDVISHWNRFFALLRAHVNQNDVLDGRNHDDRVTNVQEVIRQHRSACI